MIPNIEEISSVFFFPQKFAFLSPRLCFLANFNPFKCLAHAVILHTSGENT